MRQRTLSVSILFLATLMLLAHAIIPHHHHANKIVFKSSATCSNTCCHLNRQVSYSPESSTNITHLPGKKLHPDKHESPVDPYHPLPDQNHSKNDCCNLAEALHLFTSTQRTQIPSIHAEQHFGSGTYCLCADLPEKPLIKSDLCCLPFRQKPPTLTSYQSYANQLNGLRAPPFC